jgi:hypothetical protein
VSRTRSILTFTIGALWLFIGLAILVTPVIATVVFMVVATKALLIYMGAL